MIIELEMLQAKLMFLPDFPPELKTLLEHLIISHHGEYEFGSPKLPMFPEALLLHYMDDLDSKMESMRVLFEREGDQDNPWTSYSPSLGRPLLNTAKFLATKAVPVEPAASVMDEAVQLPGLDLSENGEGEATPVVVQPPVKA
jgi:3'-5' exoribonuclease